MKIPEIKQQLGELDIDVNDVVVVGSGILDVLGIRASRDLDVLVDEAKFREIAARGYQTFEYASGGNGLEIDDIECMDSWLGESFDEVAARAVELDGVKFMSLEEVRAWKLQHNRPKDQIDVRLIDAYLAANK